MKTYKPMFNRVLVRMKQQEGISKGGLYLPGQSRSNEGVIVACGPDCVDAKPGDTVLLDMAEIRGVSTQENDLVVTKEENIMLVIIEEQATTEGN